MAQKPTAKLLAWKAVTRFVRVIAEEKRAANEKSQKEVTDDLVKRNLTVPATAPTVRTLRWSKSAMRVWGVGVGGRVPARASVRLTARRARHWVILILMKEGIATTMTINAERIPLCP